MTNGAGLRLTDEVAGALAAGRPVVALETTLVSHGFPGGQGVEVALASEATGPGGRRGAGHRRRGGRRAPGRADRGRAGPVRRGGRVGPQGAAPAIWPPALVQGALGATTVGGTLAVCRLAGIRFMATGGTGGVHRGFAATLDISADLPSSPAPRRWWCRPESSRSWMSRPPRSCWKRLGVPVLGWRTGTLPMFYSAAGGPPVSATVTAVAEVAQITAAHFLLNAPAGLLLARPPQPSLDIEPILAEAVARVEQQGVRGQAVTPAVLALVHELSAGRSAEVNRRLIEDNAGLAAEVAVAYAELGE